MVTRAHSGQSATGERHLQMPGQERRLDRPTWADGLGSRNEYGSRQARCQDTRPTFTS